MAVPKGLFNTVFDQADERMMHTKDNRYANLIPRLNEKGLARAYIHVNEIKVFFFLCIFGKYPLC